VPLVGSINGVNLFQLNAPFVNWAYQFSHAGVTLPDTSNLQTLRALYKTFAATQSPPQVLKADVLAAGTFWIGELMNKWAENWVT
jgi:purine nucleoside permease